MPYTILDFSTSNAQITDEIINVSDSNPVTLEHDVFYNKTGKLVEIYTASGGGGTQLTEGTDYDVGGTYPDGSLPSSISPDVAYTTISITNATYHDTQLYVSYYPIGDLFQASRWNEEVRLRDPGYYVDEWDENEASAYDSAGVVVQRYGMHFTSTGLTGNSNKDPISPLNVTYWYPSPGYRELLRIAQKGLSDRGAMHKVNNVQDADYSTSLLLDKAAFGGTNYEFYLVHLDGSTLTGNATLEGIFDPGGSNEYPFIDEYAPDDLGTRTIVDKRGYVDRPMTDVGGVAETLAEMQADQMQRITGDLGYSSSDGISGGVLNDPSGAFSGTETADATDNGDSTNNRLALDFDSANSPDARTSATTDGETRVRSMVEGLGYIIVMIPA